MILDVRHPGFTALAHFVEQPQRARMALALFDHRPGQRAEEPFDVGLAHEVECQLGDRCLHVGAAFSAAALALSNQRGEHLGVVRTRRIGEAAAFSPNSPHPAPAISATWFRR